MHTHHPFQPPQRRHLHLWGALLQGLWLVFVLLAAAGPAKAQSTWRHDPTANLSLAQVQQLPAQPFKGAVSQGYGTGAVWIELHIDPAAFAPPPPHADDRLALRMRPVYLDDIQVFDPLAPNGFAGAVGDLHHPRQEAIQRSDFVLPIARGTEPRRVWLRVTSSSVRQIHVEVLPAAQLQSAYHQTEMLYGLYMGIVVLLVLWSGVNALVQHDALMGTFGLKQVGALLYGFTSLGYARVFWPAEWSAHSLSLLGSYASVLAVAGSVWFHVRFLRDYAPAPWAYRLLQGLLWLCAANLVGVALGFERLALQTNMHVILLGPLLCLLCALTARVYTQPQLAQQPVLPRALLLSFYGLIVLVLLGASTTALALAPASIGSIYLSQVHGLVTGMLVLAMLQYRSYRIGQERQHAHMQLQHAKLTAEHEHERRLEQERLLAMLAHEIKTPLATMHLRMGPNTTPDVRLAMRELNSVIERCLQAAQTEDGALPVNPQPVDLAALLDDARHACPAPERVQLELGSLPTLTTDRQLLHIVLSNLLDNACKYAAPNSPLVLEARSIEHGVRVTVSNQPGAASWPDAQHVFDKFYRAPHAQRQAGTGLGLYIVRSVLAKLGGSIRYVPSPTHVVFEVTLPVSPALG